MSLKPGTLNPAVLDGFAQSMAAAMEDAFRQELNNVPGARGFQTDQYLRLLFVAVAKGVVEHLSENPTAFKVEVPDVPGLTAPIKTASVFEIETE